MQYPVISLICVLAHHRQKYLPSAHMARGSNVVKISLMWGMADYKIITLRNLLRAPTLSLLCWQMCGQSRSQLTFHQENLAIFQNCAAKVAGFHERNRNLCMSLEVENYGQKAKKQIKGLIYNFKTRISVIFSSLLFSPGPHVRKYFALNSYNIFFYDCFSCSLRIKHAYVLAFYWPMLTSQQLTLNKFFSAS